jgi:hypothetical protein
VSWTSYAGNIHMSHGLISRRNEAKYIKIYRYLGIENLPLSSIFPICNDAILISKATRRW